MGRRKTHAVVGRRIITKEPWEIVCSSRILYWRHLGINWHPKLHCKEFQTLPIQHCLEDASVDATRHALHLQLCGRATPEPLRTDMKSANPGRLWHFSTTQCLSRVRLWSQSQRELWCGTVGSRHCSGVAELRSTGWLLYLVSKFQSYPPIHFYFLDHADPSPPTQKIMISFVTNTFLSNAPLITGLNDPVYSFICPIILAKQSENCGWYIIITSNLIGRRIIFSISSYLTSMLPLIMIIFHILFRRLPSSFKVTLNARNCFRQFDCVSTASSRRVSHKSSASEPLLSASFYSSTLSNSSHKLTIPNFTPVLSCPEYWKDVPISRKGCLAANYSLVA